jgi:hypothetical protein
LQNGHNHFLAKWLSGPALCFEIIGILHTVYLILSPFQVEMLQSTGMSN